jgi:hypothetical protein
MGRIDGYPSVTTVVTGGTVQAKTTTYSALATDGVILADATAGTWTLTLPPVSSGRSLTVKKTDATANVITVVPASGTIDGRASDVLVTQYMTCTYVSDGVNWYTIGEFLTAYASTAPALPEVGEQWVDTSITPTTQDDLAVFGSDGTLAVKTGVSRFMFPYAVTLVGTYATVGTAPTGANLILDVLKNGTTIYTTTANRPTITAGSNASSTSPPTPDVTAAAAGDYLTVSIVQVGSTVAGSDLTVLVRYRRS